MNQKSQLFNSYIIKSILSNNEFNVIDINQLEDVRIIKFDFCGYPQIEDFIRNGKFDMINETTDDTFPKEYLIIMEFIDQKNGKYFVSIYDSDELWQDPEVIKIYRQE